MTCSRNFDRLLQATCLGLVGMLVVAGCGGSSNNPDAKPQGGDGGLAPGAEAGTTPVTLTIAPVSVTFGSVDVGDTSATPQVITVTNAGATAVSIAPSVTGPFSISQICVSVPAKGTCQISVVFTPTAVGPVSGVLSVTGTLAVSLSGTGVPAGNFSVADVSLGQVATNAVVPGAVTVTATAPVSDLVCSVSGADLTADPTKVCPAALATGASCTVGFTFKATTSGQKTDSVVCNAAGLTKTAVVSATVLDPAKLVITPTSTTFQTPNGTQSAAVTFGVANSGGLSTGQVSATLTGANANQFAITVPGCLAPLAGASGCTVQVVCNPTSVGTKTATLAVADATTATDTVSANLTCVSVGPTTITVSGTANLGSVVVGNTGTAQTFTVTNSGTTATGTLTVSVADPQFVTSSDTCTGTSLAAAGTCTISVALKPTTVGQLGTILNVANAGGTPGSIQLSGTGLPPGALTITPSSKDFGSIPLNTVSADVSFTVSNGGGAATGALTVSAPGNGFVVSGNGCAAALQPTQTCVIAVHFAPTVVGNATGTLTVTDGTLSGSATLHGTGMAPSVLTVAPGQLNFGNVVVGYAETTVTLTSSPFQVLTVTLVATATTDSGTITEVLSGANAADFAVSAANTNCTTLQPGQSCTVAVTFTPSAAGLRQAVLTVTGSKGGTYQVQLQGTGLPLIQLIPVAADSTTTPPVTGLDFGMQPNGTEGTVLRYRAVVRGDVNSAAISTVATIGLAAGTPPDFTYVVPTDVHAIAPWTVTNTNPCNAGTTLALPPTDSASPWVTNVSTPTNASGTGDGQATNTYWTCDFYVMFYPQSGQSTTAKTATLSASTTGGAQAASLTLTGISSGPLTINPAAPVFTTTITVGTSITALTLADEQTFTVANMGVGNVNQGPLTVALGGTNAGDFGIIADNCSTQTLVPDVSLLPLTSPTPNSTCTIEIGFAPTSPGSKTATITVTAAGSGQTAQATISGTASQAGAVTVTPTAAPPAHVDFGSVAQANTSAWKTFTITNPATGTATGKLTYSVDDTSNFQVFSLSNSGATSYPAGSCGAPNTTQLSPGANCTIQVAFTPNNATVPSTTPRTANLTVKDATSGVTLATVPIQGTATAQLTLSGAAISLDPKNNNAQTLAFGNVATGAQMPETFTITNNGATAATAASLALAGSLPTGFTVTSSACNVGTVLAGGASCQMTLVFTGASVTGPVATGITFTGGPTGVSAPLALTATTVKPATLALYGFGDLGSPTAPVGSIDFGSAPVSTNSGILTLWFTNLGQVPAVGLQTTWVQTGTQFSLAENPGTCTTVGSLAPSATCSVNVQFTPTAAAGLQTAVLSLFGQAIAAVNVNLQGTGIATSNSVYAQPVGGTNSFYTFAGTTAVGSTTGTTAYFVLYNNTTANVALGSDATTFAGAAIAFAPGIGGSEGDFTLTKATTTGAGVACGTGNLAPAGFCTFAVTFKPTSWVGTGTRDRWAAVSGPQGNILGVLGQVQQPAQLQLSATATSAVTITGVTPAFFVDFGQILVGQTPSLTFTISNVGQAPTAGAPSLKLTGTSTFATVGTSTCGTGTTALAAGGTCTVVVNSQLTSVLGPNVGLSVQAVDTATGGSGETSLETYFLQAEVVNPVSLVVTPPSSTNFGSTQVGVPTTALTIIVTNGSGGDTVVTRQTSTPLQVQLSDSTNFAVDPSSTCINPSGGYVALPTPNPGSVNSCSLVIDFAPLAAGAMTTNVSVAGATPNPVTLTGTGLSDLSISPNSNTNPVVLAGTPPSASFTVTNANSSQVTKLLREALGGTNATAFAITDDTCYGTPLSTGNCTVTVTFIGTVSTTTAQTASLTVTDGTANNTASVAMSVGGP
ncbi:MAG: choice-of-anchor D domain-containing protein [Polyangia bacterium]